VLGDHHDAVVAMVTLHDFSSGATATPEMQFVAGELAGVFLVEARRLRKRWRRQWRHVRDRDRFFE
jgi:hypothetical protein